MALRFLKRLLLIATTSLLLLAFANTPAVAAEKQKFKLAWTFPEPSVTGRRGFTPSPLKVRKLKPSVALKKTSPHQAGSSLIATTTNIHLLNLHHWNIPTGLLK